LLRKDTQVWENDVLMITGLQVYKTTGDALTQLTFRYANFLVILLYIVSP
jgi:hypothetical protein